MNICHGCGGILGCDCFNPQECEDICRQKAEQYDIACAESHEFAGMLEEAYRLVEVAFNHAPEEWQQKATEWRSWYNNVFRKADAT